MDKWLKFDHMEATVMEALEKLNDLVDESDPDIDLPNIIHAFQTAEQIRADHPDKEWFQLTGLIHDLGKVSTDYGICYSGITQPPPNNKNKIVPKDIIQQIADAL